MTEPAIYQLYHPDPNTCPALAVDGSPKWAFFPKGGTPTRQQYTKVVNWKQNCYLCPYCGSRVEAAAMHCFACQGRFLAPAGVRCRGHQLEGHMTLIPRHILREVADAAP